MRITADERTAKLLDILASNEICDKEIAHRKKQLEQAEKSEGGPVSIISDRYYNLAHEIKSFAFLQSLGVTTLSSDSNGTAGCDLTYNGNYQVECVCASAGVKAAENGFTELCQMNVIIDYSQKKAIINSRITSEFAAKVEFFEKHVEKGTISVDKPYIIFLGLGALATHMFAKDNGMALTDVLLGRGNPTLTINQNNKVIDKGYTHNEFFPKPGATDAPINCNLFCSPSFRCVSGILFSDSLLDDDYDINNTWLFLNPFANVSINPEDFPGITYWTATDENSQYAAFRSNPIV